MFQQQHNLGGKERRVSKSLKTINDHHGKNQANTPKRFRSIRKWIKEFKNVAIDKGLTAYYGIFEGVTTPRMGEWE